MQFVFLIIFYGLAVSSAQAEMPSIESLNSMAFNRVFEKCFFSRVFEQSTCRDVAKHITELMFKYRTTGDPSADAVANLNHAIGIVSTMGPDVQADITDMLNAPSQSVAESFAVVINSFEGFRTTVVDGEIKVSVFHSAPLAQRMERCNKDKAKCRAAEKVFLKLVDALFDKYERIAAGPVTPPVPRTRADIAKRAAWTLAAIAIVSSSISILVLVLKFGFLKGTIGEVCLVWAAASCAGFGAVCSTDCAYNDFHRIPQ